MHHPPRRRTALPRVLAALLLAGGLLLPAGPAWAHNQLTRAVPAPESTLDTVPEQVVLEFVEALNPQYTTVVLTDAAGAVVPIRPTEVTGNRATVTFAAPLGGGTYTVAYRVVSQDGHPVQGAYPFTVAGPGGAVVPEPEVTPAPGTSVSVAAVDPTPRADRSRSGTVVALVGAGVLLVAGVLALVVRRGRRTRS